MKYDIWQGLWKGAKAFVAVLIGIQTAIAALGGENLSFESLTIGAIIAAVLAGVRVGSNWWKITGQEPKVLYKPMLIFGIAALLSGTMCGCDTLTKTVTITYPDGRIETIKQLDITQIAELIETYGPQVKPMIDQFKDLWEYLHDAEQPEDPDKAPAWLENLRLVAANAQEIRTSLDILLAGLINRPSGKLALKSAVATDYALTLEAEYARLDALGIQITH